MNPSYENSETTRSPVAQNNSIRWARRAVRYYLIAAGVVLFFYWDGWNDLGPNYLLVGLLNWPVSGISVSIVELLLGTFRTSLDYDQHKIPIVASILLTGIVYWGAIGFLAEKSTGGECCKINSFLTMIDSEQT